MTKNINMTMCWWADEATNLPACHRGENILSGHFVNLSMASEKSPQCLGLCSVFVLGVGRVGLPGFFDGFREEFCCWIQPMANRLKHLGDYIYIYI